MREVFEGQLFNTIMGQVPSLKKVLDTKLVHEDVDFVEPIRH
jgi:hypothetical protein